MLSALNIDDLMINYIDLNDLINKRMYHVVWVEFEFIIFDIIIIYTVFELTNTIEYMHVDKTPTLYANTNFQP